MVYLEEHTSSVEQQTGSGIGLSEKKRRNHKEEKNEFSETDTRIS